jgi:hypothetical protein
MSAMKQMIEDILEELTATGMDYWLVAREFDMTPEEVYAIAKEYGDVE